jgi:hypothetical protein
METDIGAKFIDSYNKKFLKQKSDFINYLEGNFESDETFSQIFDKYIHKLWGLQSVYYEQDGFIVKCSESEFHFRYTYYDKNAVLNVVNKNIREQFEKHQSDYDSKIKDYQVFSEVLCDYSILKDFENLIRKEIDKIKTSFKKKNVKTILKVKKQINAEYLVYYWKPKEDGDLEIERVNVKEKEEFSSILLNDDEKLLLLHLLYVCSRNANYKLNPVEFLSAIKLTNDVHNGKNLQDFYGTDYKKIKDGLKYYQGNNSKIKMMLDQINKICTDYQLSVIKDFIRTIYPK